MPSYASFTVETRLLHTGSEDLSPEDVQELHDAYTASVESEIRFKALSESIRTAQSVVIATLKYADRANETVSVDFNVEPASITKVEAN